MNWPSLVDLGVYGTGAFLGGGSMVALIEGVFRRPHTKALTEKERTLSDSVKTDSSTKLVELWMASNEKQVASNQRLEKSNERLLKANERLHHEVDQVRGEMHREVGAARREINDTREVMRSLVSVVERFMPLLRQTLGNEAELGMLNDALAQARALNGGAK